jgi:hypothetical protein
LLPAPIHGLSQEDAMSTLNCQILGVSHVQPTAACFIPPENGQHQHQTINSESISVNLNVFRKNAGLLDPNRPLMASAVFLSANIFGFHKPPFEVMRRYNRLATTSLLREACSLQIDVPIVGILLRDNLAVVHIDWYEIFFGEMVMSNKNIFAWHFIHSTSAIQLSLHT